MPWSAVAPRAEIGPRPSGCCILRQIGIARARKDVGFRNGTRRNDVLVTPLNRSSGGKEKLGRISKMGDRYVRRLLVTGVTARLRQIKAHPDRVDPWTLDLLARKPAHLTTVAMANKTARIIWAVLTRNEHYRPHTA